MKLRHITFLIFKKNSGRFDTSGSMIPLLVPEISPCDCFFEAAEEQQELGILVVGCLMRLDSHWEKIFGITSNNETTLKS